MRKVLVAEPAMDSLQTSLSLVKVDTTNSVYIVSCLACQTIEEQIYQCSLLGFVVELDLALFAQFFELRNLHIQAKMNVIFCLENHFLLKMKRLVHECQKQCEENKLASHVTCLHPLESLSLT